MSARYFEGAAHAAAYAKFRPIPPLTLINRTIDYLKTKCPTPFETAIDIGCGSGQSTRILASSFNNLVGLDVSAAQVAEAAKSETLPNITYKVSSAEELPFDDNSITLVTAGQAAHWFDLPKFFKEIDRILIPHGVLAMYGYSFPIPKYDNKSDQLEKIMREFESGLAEFFGQEIMVLNEHYVSIQIPYEENERVDNLNLTKRMTVSQFSGYLSSWSGVVNYSKKYGEEAGQKLLKRFEDDILATIGENKTAEETELDFDHPYFLLLGRKP